MLSGCKTVYVEKAVYVSPPDTLMQDCQIHSIKGNLVKDAIEQSIMNIESLQFCNADKKAMREWKDSLEKK